MCFFVFVACSAEDVEQTRALLRSSFHITESANPWLRKLLPAESRAWFLSDGPCGCTLYSDPTGERRDPLQELEERITRFRAKHIKPAYRKKGWSDAKIERAIQQMRADNRPLPKFSGVRKDLRCALAELATDCGSIHVLAHEFRGAIDDEAIAAKRDAINTTLLVEDDAAILPDVLYEIRGER